jgi:hypothetical protein
MHKIKRSFWERLSQNVVAPNFQVGRLDGLKKTRLKIGCDDVTTAAYLSAEPGRNRAASSSYFETTPTFSHSYLSENPDRPGVHPRFE